ncbi:tRNA (N(6)-L-threonylcarbamoyladenosine(37)-C(2))-methylthiotransferase MtaB [uncultured Phascolarctobacterium sp.]|uniref:tRNA (N(6)-L-threonylcarbamoyladenosine(37)-C(2))- methylthiotransferase MtaB n=1 Tax=uncultured Phascolarctobacterium sp. TaxID=512296 RepID=UPI00262080BD|nr:tRNA (N(6)-L-threonylcarbamoyladenosine(37)-C(2))-methylthiotransferase MtaB [uncultured Phascolarctobacterium sp.]
MKRIAFYTLGCKVNQADTASMETLFRSHGYTIVDFNGEADIYVINTCVVTNTGQRKSRQMINRVVRRNPTALVVVTGCYPQTAAEEVKAIAGVDLIIGNQDRAEIVGLVEAAAETQRVDTIDSVRKLSANTEFEELSVGEASDKTRAFLKIQEGCNQFCTYCIIPFARGPLRSRSLTSIKEETAKLVAAGYKEIVLIGIHLGCYGKEHDGRLTLFDAVEAALSVEGLQRLRLGSLESVEVEPRLLELMEQDKRLCRQLHLPLQAGCDTTLARMHRPYDTRRFAELLGDIRKRIPDIAITTDIIAGFPGETEDEFMSTLAFAENCGFSKMHIFPYSKRKGTPAEKMPNQIPETVKQKRCAQLAEIDHKQQQSFLEQCVGSEAEVLFEQTAADGYIEGLTSNYLRVYVQGGAELCGTLRKVRLLKAETGFLVGELL